MYIVIVYMYFLSFYLKGECCDSLFIRFLSQYKDVYETDLKCEVKILHSSSNVGAQSQLSPPRETEVRLRDNSSCVIW